MGWFSNLVRVQHARDAWVSNSISKKHLKLETFGRLCVCVITSGARKRRRTVTTREVQFELKNGNAALNGRHLNEGYEAFTCIDFNTNWVLGDRMLRVAYFVVGSRTHSRVSHWKSKCARTQCVREANEPSENKKTILRNKWFYLFMRKRCQLTYS